MAEVGAEGKIPETRNIASRHSGSVGRHAREAQTSRLRQPQMDWRSRVTIKHLQKKTQKAVFIEDFAIEQ